MESFFPPLKTERTARRVYRTSDEARADVFALRRLQAIVYRPEDDIECFHNRRRRLSKLGYLSPMEFEARARLA